MDIGSLHNGLFLISLLLLVLFYIILSVLFCCSLLPIAVKHICCLNWFNKFHIIYFIFLAVGLANTYGVLFICFSFSSVACSWICSFISYYTYISRYPDECDLLVSCICHVLQYFLDALYCSVFTIIVWDRYYLMTLIWLWLRFHIHLMKTINGKYMFRFLLLRLFCIHRFELLFVYNTVVKSDFLDLFNSRFITAETRESNKRARGKCNTNNNRQRRINSGTNTK